MTDNPTVTVLGAGAMGRLFGGPFAERGLDFRGTRPKWRIVIAGE